MLRKIKLYGKLAKFIGKRVLEADVATAAEAVRFLVANWPEVEKHMSDQHYRVSIGTYDLSQEELHDPSGQQLIKIVPVVAGSGGAAGRIILGVALVALSFWIPGAAAAAWWAGNLATGAAVGLAYAAPIIGMIGASLALGGLAQLISPVPRSATGTDSQQDARKSYSFSGIQNTSRQGTPVPIVYGETLVGSVVISAGIDTVQITA
jgi:predicted phage tail protein